MSFITTPHINAEADAFGKTVLMPGDPLRSKFIAENYLENAKLGNNVRGIQGYTGTYKGTKVSVMASGMGMPTIGIYQADQLHANYHVGNVLSSDTFYSDDKTATAGWQKMGVLCVEMEAAALYMNAARLSKRALAMFTISDNLLNGGSLSGKERQEGFDDMIKLSLETAVLSYVQGGK